MSEYSRVYKDWPDLWDEGLSYLAKVEYVDGNQRIIADGWHKRQIEFENQIVQFHEAKTGEATIDVGVEENKEGLWEGVKTFEVEVALNSKHFDAATMMLSHLVDARLATQLVESVGSMIQRVSANRSDTQLVDEHGNSIPSVDLLAQNLPARSGNHNEPLRILHRWCRIFQLRNGTITLYEPLDEERKSNLRWPHYGIWLNRGSEYFLRKSSIGSIFDAVEIPIKYEQYNLENWRIEFDMWENQPFQIVTSGDSDVAARRLGTAQKEIGILSEFITTAFLAARNLERRTKRNQLFLENTQLRDMATKRLDEIKNTIEEGRLMLYRASELLANTAQSVQAMAEQKNVEAAQKTNTFLTIASALFFAPTLIISFYSMSIIGLNEQEHVPSSMMVLLICLASVLLTLVFAGAVRLVNKVIRNKKISRKMESNND
ncbi:CorA family divalent cation transporter [Corynebacterium casei]|uniref:CorA family divalent cation transporter n=2 Tax=Corynebacterium casei TaxID=160386 RepID=UPI003FD681FC